MERAFTHFTKRFTNIVPSVCLSGRMAPGRWGMVAVSIVAAGLLSAVQAAEPEIQYGHAWVEDGYIFHIDFEVSPYQKQCAATGAGYIGFNVYYQDARSLDVDWTFGLAPWPHGWSSHETVKSHLVAYGPQAFCTRFSPCTITHVHMVKKWCPIRE